MDEKETQKWVFRLLESQLIQAQSNLSMFKLLSRHIELQGRTIDTALSLIGDPTQPERNQAICELREITNNNELVEQIRGLIAKCETDHEHQAATIESIRKLL